jgi:hypothetical protein
LKHERLNGLGKIATGRETESPLAVEETIATFSAQKCEENKKEKFLQRVV